MQEIDEVFRRAGFEPHESSTALAELDALELQLGRALPRAFRRLFSLDGAIEFLERHSNSDQPIPVAQLLAGQRWSGYDPVAQGLLPFMVENQGVCAWAISLASGDDPEVLIEVDSGSPPTWQLLSPRLSTWLRCQVDDTLLLKAATHAAQAPPLAPAILDRLLETFAESDRTYAWPGRINLRLANERSRLLLWSGEGQCDWWIAPRTGVDPARALADLCDVPGLMDAVYPLEQRCSAGGT